MDNLIGGVGLCISSSDFVTDFMTALDLYGFQVSKFIFGRNQSIEAKKEDIYCDWTPPSGHHHDNHWATFTLLFIFLPGLITSISDAIDSATKQVEYEENKKKKVAACLLYFCGWSILRTIAQPFIMLYYRFWYMMGSSDVMEKAMWYTGMEGHMESGPQAILQLYILCNGHVTDFQKISLVVSIITIGYCVALYDSLYENKVRKDAGIEWDSKEKILRGTISIPIYILSFLSRGGMLVIIISFFHWISLIPLGIQVVGVSLLAKKMGLNLRNMLLTSATNILIHGNPIDSNPFEQQATTFNSTAFKFRLFTSLISIINYGFWLTLAVVFIFSEIMINEKNCSMLAKDTKYIRIGNFGNLPPWSMWSILMGIGILHLFLLIISNIKVKDIPAFLPRSYAETKKELFENTERPYRPPRLPKTPRSSSGQARSSQETTPSRQKSTLSNATAYEYGHESTPRGSSGQARSSQATTSASSRQKSTLSNTTAYEYGQERNTRRSNPTNSKQNRKSKAQKNQDMDIYEINEGTDQGNSSNRKRQYNRKDIDIYE